MAVDGPGTDTGWAARTGDFSPTCPGRRPPDGLEEPATQPLGPGRRYRIAMVAACPFPAPRGTPIRIFHMASELARRGHDLDLVTYHLGHEAGDLPFRIHRTANIRTYRKWSPGPSGQKLLLLDPLLAFKLLGVLGSGRYDVIHAHHVEGLLAALFSRVRFRVPVVFDAHTTMETELPFYTQHLRGLLRRFGRALDTGLPARADHVIAVSDEIKARLCQGDGLPKERVTVIPNGVEEAFFAAAAGGAPRMDQEPCLVFAGNLAPYQGIDLLLAAFAKALQQRSDLRLRIISESRFDDHEQLASQLGVRDRVELVAADLERLPHQLAAASVLLNPRTDGDGSPQKILNYMAAGRPIVSFAGTARFLTDGQDALIVANGDVDAFAEAILRLCADEALAKRLGERAKGEARAQLSWTRTAAQVEQVYANLVPALVPAVSRMA